MSLTRVLSASLVIVALSHPVSGALFIVDNQIRDAGDWNPGDGTCSYNSTATKPCTLRAAVQEANALAGADVILIPDGWHIVLDNTVFGVEDFASSGDLDIRADVAIGSLAAANDWPIVDGGGIDRVFDVHPPAKLTLSKLQVTGGDTLANGAGESGGAWVRTGASADFFDCRFYGNRGTDGAISNDGNLLIARCSFRENSGNNGALTATISNRHHLVIQESEIVDNLLSKAAVFNESASGLTIRNSTISRNTGFGISSRGDLALRNVTITDHPATGLSVFQPGAFASPSIRNSIIANNLQDCSITIPGGAPDTAHPNLDSDGTCGFLPAFGGLPNTDPMLGPLLVNGGTTRTMVPRESSPVIDAGDNGTCEGAQDQRGASRVLDGGGGADCDLGAVEVLPCVGTPHLVVFGDIISGVATYTGCFTVSAGPAIVTSSGNATFRARDGIAFVPGFSVDPGGRIRTVLDPAAGSGMTLP